MWYAPLADNSTAYNGLNYYYFGHYLGAFLIKLTGIKNAVGFNLFVATIVATSAVQTFSLITTLGHRLAIEFGSKLKSWVLTAIGLVGMMLVNFSGNLQVLYAFTTSTGANSAPPIWQVWTGKLDLANYSFAGATRVFNYSINEIPSYSHVIGDAHGHVLSLPITLTILLLLSILFFILRSITRVPFKEISKNIVTSSFWLTGLIGILIGLAYMTNAADLLTYGGLTSLVLVVASKELWRKLKLLGTLGISILITTLQFNLNYTSIIKSIGINCAPEWLIKLKSFGPFLFEADKCQRSEWYLIPIAWGVGLLGAFVVIWLSLTHKQVLKSKWVQWLLSLGFFGIFLILVPEFLYFKDIYKDYFRANTMFKLGFQAYVLLAIVTALSLLLVWIVQSKSKWFSYFKYGYSLLIGMILLATMLYVPFAVYGYSKITSSEGSSLDGNTWMTKTLPGEYELINWMNTNIKGQPTILEAFGESYGLYGRVSSNTGLPTPGNWRGHEWIWRANEKILDDRIFDMFVMYCNPVRANALPSLQKYSVKYVVVSNLERIKYPQLTTEQFDALGKIEYRDDVNNISLYELSY
jgi:uncharacterized membrane protein